jgi:hypothetical protein
LSLFSWECAIAAFAEVHEATNLAVILFRGQRQRTHRFEMIFRDNSVLLSSLRQKGVVWDSMFFEKLANAHEGVWLPTRDNPVRHVLIAYRQGKTPKAGLSVASRRYWLKGE